VVIVANYSQRAINPKLLCVPGPHRLGRYYALLGLLGAFGVLAFIFSLSSPTDDDIQPECFLSSKSKQCFRTNYKAVSNLRAFRICSIRSALAPPTLQTTSYDVTARVYVTGDEIKDRICSSRTGDRSPPAKLS
jgi:hypothetical protein